MAPGGAGSFAFLNASSSVLSNCWSSPDLRRQLAPLVAPATMSTSPCNMTIQTAGNMPNAVLRFFATASWRCKDLIVQYALPCLGIRRKRALGTTASKTQPEQYAVSEGIRIALTCMSCSKECLFNNTDASTKVGHKELARETGSCKRTMCRLPAR